VKPDRLLGDESRAKFESKVRAELAYLRQRLDRLEEWLPARIEAEVLRCSGFLVDECRLLLRRGRWYSAEVGGPAEGGLPRLRRACDGHLWDTSDVTIEQETHKPSRRTAAAAGWCGLALLAVPMAMHFNWPVRDLGIPEWAADAVLVMLLVGIFAGCTAWTRKVRPVGKGVRGFVAELAFLFALSLLSGLFFGGVLYVVALKMR
jgi:hypothetical protein